MILPISSIAITKRQRKNMDPNKLAELAASIFDRAGRLINPIVVRRTDEGETYPANDERAGKPITQQYVLVAGGRRTAAHVLRGKSEIEARLLEDLSPRERAILELEENLGREDLSAVDELEAKAAIFAELQQETTTPLTALAERTGEDKSNLSKELKLAAAIKADPSLRTLTTKNAIRKAVEHKAELTRRVEAVRTSTSSENLLGLKSRLTIEDARSWLRRQPSNSSHIFSDPPWGIDYKSASDIAKDSGTVHQGKYDDSKDNVLDVLTDCIPEMVRILKDDGWMVLIFGTTGMNWLKVEIMGRCRTHHEGWVGVEYDHEGGGDFRRMGDICGLANKPGECVFLNPEILPWIWHRPNSRNLGQWPDRHAKHVYESILVVPGPKARLVQQHRPDVLVHDAVYNERLHEMQKPHALGVDVLSRIAVAGERVIDPFFGSGALLAAAAEKGLDFHGCDNNPTNLGSAILLAAAHYKGKAVHESLANGRTNAAAAASEVAALEREESALDGISDDEAASIQ